jgi:pimeloyl-ACP methyl ester carboxylesterase
MFKTLASIDNRNHQRSSSEAQIATMANKELAPSYHDVEVETSLGPTTVHYVEAGDKSKPVFLLLMGFPSSTTHYRDFIPLVADKFHVLAPDFPGYGLTKVPDNFVYTFDNLTVVISAWLKKMGITSYASYMFDYGAPVGFRLALENPKATKAIVTQNGNAYDEGFGQEFWAPIFNLWNTKNSQEAREVLRDNILTQGMRTDPLTLYTRLTLRRYNNLPILHGRSRT